MAISVQKFREIVFQMLYSYDFMHINKEETEKLLMRELAITNKVVKEAHSRVSQIIEKIPEMDEMIAKTSRSYEFERIQSVERNILRLSLFELLFDPSIPPKVIIAEAIRLARKFSTPESASFVNAILDTLYKSHE